MAYDSAHGLAVLFGGENFLGGPNSMSQQYFADTWTWGVPVVVTMGNTSKQLGPVAGSLNGQVMGSDLHDVS